MTEEEWNATQSRFPIFEYLEGNASQRKLRLFACACVGRIRPLLPTDLFHPALFAAEGYADGNTSSDELKSIATEAYYSSTGPDYPHDVVIDELTRSAVNQLTGHLGDAFETMVGTSGYALEAVGGSPTRPDKNEERAQCLLLRDIFGNPFRPVVADSAWLTPTVQSIAAAIYADRAFDRLPILAYALEEVGCTNADVLLHCRQPAEHVRGCWVVDLVLGKE